MNVGMPALCLFGALLSICALITVCISWISMFVFCALMFDAAAFIILATWFIMS